MVENSFRSKAKRLGTKVGWWGFAVVLVPYLSAFYFPGWDPLAILLGVGIVALVLYFTNLRPTVKRNVWFVAGFAIAGNMWHFGKGWLGAGPSIIFWIILFITLIVMTRKHKDPVELRPVQTPVLPAEVPAPAVVTPAAPAPVAAPTPVALRAQNVDDDQPLKRYEI